MKKWTWISVVALVAVGCGDDGGRVDDTMMDVDAQVPMTDAQTPMDASEADLGGECPAGMAGDDCSECAAGHQDVDGDGTCQLACAAPPPDDLDCGDRGACVESTETGLRGCECDEGYGGETCETCADGFAESPLGDCVPVPNLLPGLQIWMDATNGDEMVVNDSDEVTSWSNVIGSEVLVGQSGARPAFVADHWGEGRPALVFDGADRMATTGSTDAFADEYAVYLVVSAVSGGGQGVLSVRQSTNYGVILETFGPATYEYRHRNPFGTTGGDAVATLRPTDEVHLVRIRRTAGLVQLSVAEGTDLSANESQEVGANSGALGGSPLFELGRSENGFLEGAIGEVLVFDGTLTADDRDMLVEYLGTKWGL